MTPERERTVLVVDDDEAVRASIRRVLGDHFRVEALPGGAEALLRLDAGEVQPDVILLDIRMPGLDGYQVCARIQEREEWSWIPVIFVTVLTSDQDRKRALESGGAGYVTKPFEAGELVEAVRDHLGRRDRWAELRDETDAREEPEETEETDAPRIRAAPDREADRVPYGPDRFQAFKEHLAELRDVSGERRAIVEMMGPGEVYALAEALEMAEEQIAEELASFLDIPFVQRIRISDQALGALPRAFCRTNEVVPLEDGKVVLANPFDVHLADALERGLWRGEERQVALSAPGRIRGVFTERGDERGPGSFEGKPLVFDRVAAEEVETEGARRANEIMRAAVAAGASDVHLQPREGRTEVRFRVEGQMETVETLSPGETAQVISRLKALAGMDLAERRRPQDGSVRAHLEDRRFKLRLATSSTVHGESMVVRILEPEAERIPLEELGMTDQQADVVRETAQRTQGALLMVGPTGSGKSTTIYTLFAHVDGARRSIMSVEDPVEYTLRNAHQQEVNEQAGLTFESLLRSSVRQDPDILFLGEIRDEFSAQAVLDFASSGHLTISSLHAANATAAIFRLQRLGVERGSMAEAISMVVSQKLVRTLCPECKEISEPTIEEEELLGPFVDEMPERVARPVGCSACRNTGYEGREAVFEVLSFDREIREKVRRGTPVRQLRDLFRERDDLLLAQHALRKVRELRYAVADVHRTVLLEEGEGERRPAERSFRGPPTLLLVDPDDRSRRRVAERLEGGGYRVEEAPDGVEALWELSRTPVAGVVVRVGMATLEAPTLLLLIERKGIELPVVFLVDEADERRESVLLAHGAADVVRTDAEPELLLARVGRVVPVEPGRDETAGGP